MPVEFASLVDVSSVAEDGGNDDDVDAVVVTVSGSTIVFVIPAAIPTVVAAGGGGGGNAVLSADWCTLSSGSKLIDLVEVWPIVDNKICLTR